MQAGQRQHQLRRQGRQETPAGQPCWKGPLVMVEPRPGLHKGDAGIPP